MDAILWRRLDVPGHDACRLVQRAGGWRLEGTAVFQHSGGSACLAYEVDCDSTWRTRRGVVRGWVGARPLALRIIRTSRGIWSVNGVPAPQVNGCVDLDLGFTPSTNLFQLRRVALAIGQAADVPVAWLDVPDGAALERLQQRYERRTAEGYWYESPRFGYAALLQVRANGFVESYPALWELA